MTIIALKEVLNLNETVHYKRLSIVVSIFAFVFLILLGRIFYIQVIKSEEYSKKAVTQRTLKIPVALNRGEIYDRNLIPLTDREVEKVILVYSDYIYDKKSTAEIISKACGISIKEVEDKLTGSVDTIEFSTKLLQNPYLEALESGKINGVIVVEKKQRYTDESIARHVIGYIGKSDKKGYMGIEKSLNQYLAGDGYDSVVAVVDSGLNIIPGLGFRKVEADKNGQSYSVKLTLDYHIQSIIEEEMKKNNTRGAVVVMDVATSEILGMGSFPDYDQNDISKYIDNNGDELLNKALWSFDLGSIFKTVVAAAAFENNLITLDDKFICTGSYKVGNTNINCSTYKSHENTEINIKDAFSLSCNTTFVKIGEIVGAEKILDMAKKFGFGQKQLYTFSEEKSGNLPEPNEDGIGNISIGQGKIQATPLQVTSMMATIANNGIRRTPVIVDELLTYDGKEIKKMEREKPEVIMSYSTANQLKSLLSEVTKTGTGKQANMDEYGGSSGKTSSAQTGISTGVNGATVVQGWFAGFVPSNSPKYAITVFVYDGQSGGSSAAPLFKDIATRILNEAKH